MANGCFDPFHVGHLYYLKEAKSLGRVLIVSVTADAYVNKPSRPIFPAEERAAVIRELRCVDGVIIVKSGDEAVRRIKPDIYVKGKEYEGKLTEQGYVESYGGRVVFTSGPIYSSTALVTGRYLEAECAAGGGLHKG
ncbi:MAG TPA: adenylyltransferase/cytidyltransferase family protein [Candidatus Binatia bacterium]|nr:adenylyltransferase/cytidyltransferase family protein [Candidatus Binatia bacterium]